MFISLGRLIATQSLTEKDRGRGDLDFRLAPPSQSSPVEGEEVRIRAPRLPVTGAARAIIGRRRVVDESRVVQLPQEVQIPHCQRTDFFRHGRLHAAETICIRDRLMDIVTSTGRSNGSNRSIATLRSTASLCSNPTSFFHRIAGDEGVGSNPSTALRQALDSD
jgi:hypothetical protein